MPATSNSFVCPHCQNEIAVSPLIEDDVEILMKTYDNSGSPVNKELPDYVIVPMFIKTLPESFRNENRVKEADALDKFSAAYFNEDILKLDNNEFCRKMKDFGFSNKFIRLWQFYNQTGKLKPEIYRVKSLLAGNFNNPSALS